MTRLLAAALALAACGPAKRLAVDCAELTEERRVAETAPGRSGEPFRFLVWCRAPGSGNLRKSSN